MIKLLTNNAKENHEDVIINNLKFYDQAFIAVAFLKSSGLKLLLSHIGDFLNKGGILTIIAGQNFGLTEPQALKRIYFLLQAHPKSKIYLAKADLANSIFHPKLYLFRRRNNCCIISGSANLTEGGLKSNRESSIVAMCEINDNVWIDAKAHFEWLISSNFADEATLLLIKQYEVFFELQKIYNKKAKPIPVKTKSQLSFNYDNLLKYLEEFDSRKRDKDFKIKTRNYKEARAVLDSIIDHPNLNQSFFEHKLDMLVGSKNLYNLWHSGSLFRLRKKVYPYFKEFKDLALYIRTNKSLPANVVFENAKEKVGNIEGAAVNYITEIMMTYNTKEYANINSNPIFVLREEAGVNIKSHSSSFTSYDYEEYCELVKEISIRLGLRNMLEADSFFNDIYWKIK